MQPSEAFTFTLSGVTGSTTSDTYNLSNAVVSDGTTTKLLSAAISAGWLTMYSWNTSSQSFTALSGTETISPWIGYWFDATKAADRDVRGRKLHGLHLDHLQPPGLGGARTN